MARSRLGQCLTFTLLTLFTVAATVNGESFTLTVEAGETVFQDITAGAATLSFSLEAGSPVSLFMVDPVTKASYESSGVAPTSGSSSLTCLDATSCVKTSFLGESFVIIAFAVSNDGDEAVTATVNVLVYNDVAALDRSFQETVFQLPRGYEIYPVYYDCTMEYTIESLDGSTAVVVALDGDAYWEWLMSGASGVPTGYSACSTTSSCSKTLTETPTSNPLLLYLVVTNENTILDGPAKLSFTLDVTGCSLDVTQAVASASGGSGDNGDNNDNGDNGDNNAVTWTDSSGDGYVDLSGVFGFLLWLLQMVVFFGCCCCVCCILPGAVVVLFLRTRKSSAAVTTDVSSETMTDYPMEKAGNVQSPDLITQPPDLLTQNTDEFSFSDEMSFV